MTPEYLSYELSMDTRSRNTIRFERALQLQALSRQLNRIYIRTRDLNGRELSYLER